MNIEQAKRIPLSLILETINCHPVKQNEKEAWYIAPWRDEKTASFHVTFNKNVWYDHGEGIGGNSVDFACTRLKFSGEDCTVSDALRWLSNMTVQPLAFMPLRVANSKEQIKSWIKLKSGAIEELALIRYLEKRGISAPLAKKHVQQVQEQNSESSAKIYALGFKNEDGGFELRNSFFKSCVAPKTITFIRGSVPMPGKIHLFEGFMDYLTFLTIRKGRQEEDVIVLNSISCIHSAIPYIKNYGYRIAYTWMDNDKTGVKATNLLSEFFKTEANIQHKPMNKVYKSSKDLNAWHMQNLNLSL